MYLLNSKLSSSPHSGLHLTTDGKISFLMHLSQWVTKAGFQAGDFPSDHLLACPATDLL